jgi:hypothetical protein
VKLYLYIDDSFQYVSSLAERDDQSGQHEFHVEIEM